MGNMKKKFDSGAASQYLTRKQALKKLQLSLKMFRRLCILKGIYPREPKNRKKAQRGATDKKTLYLKKDIQFLLREPIMWKLREHKVYLRKKSRARALRNMDELERIMENKPTYTLDHIVKERYPTFVDALRDLDDCLTLCFLFSTFPSMRFVPGGVSLLCRRLTIEFLHYVIEAKALRKVFVSVKGYYYQADIKGQTITWIVPHHYGFQPQSPDDVDFRIMATFVEFYCTLLGFINFRLFHSLNICYPPKLTPFISGSSSNSTALSSEELISEHVAALNHTLLKTVIGSGTEEAESEFDQFPSGESQNDMEEMKKEVEKIEQAKTMFGGLKFFLNREVPRESLTFLIRTFGGQVSWDQNLFIGAAYNEDDPTITHQIVDREVSNKKHLSRYYVQPQWIFDSINAKRLLPVEDYFPGVVLPPHVSPFMTEREGDYIPPEKKLFLDMDNGISVPTHDFESTMKQSKSKAEKAIIQEEEEEADSSGEDEEEDDDDDEDEPVSKKNLLTKQMKVQRGKPELVDTAQQKSDETKEEYRLRVLMMKNKHKRLYRKMMDSRHRRSKEADRLVSKRQKLENSEEITEKVEKPRKSKRLSAK